ncbi:MAG: GIY-YIG nuclease family protein [Limisphaerales bacterium]
MGIVWWHGLSQFIYAYALRSRRDGWFYVGFTTDLKQRFAGHNAGRVESTCGRVPLELGVLRSVSKPASRHQTREVSKKCVGKTLYQRTSPVLSRGVKKRN